MKIKKLNLGCGRDIKKGYVNLDKFKLEGVDVVHDLDIIPYPFDDEEFDEVVCNSIIEHLEDIPKVMQEIWRILRPIGILKIIVPHFTSINAYTDPTHKHFFAYESFDFFTENGKYTFHNDFKYKIVTKRIIFGKKFAIWNYLLEPISNRFPVLYENTILRIFPALNIYIEMEKINCK